MASYTELFTVAGNVDFRNRVEIAALVAADAIRAEATGTANHAEQLRWANRTWLNPRKAAEALVGAVLAANKGAPLSTITDAEDTTIQTAVDAAVDIFALQIPAPA